MTEDSTPSRFRMASEHDPRLRLTFTVIYLALLAIVYYKFSDALWLAPILALALSVLYFMPCVFSVALATSFIMSWFRFGYYLMSAVQADYQFEPYYFAQAVFLFAIVALPSAALPLVFKAAMHLMKRNFWGKNYGWAKFKIDFALSLVLSVVVITTVYVGTHREPGATISKLYHQAIDLSLDDLADRAGDSSLPSEERGSALLVLSGMGLKVDQVDERTRIIQQLKSEIGDTDTFESAAADYALKILERTETAEFSESDFHFLVRLTVTESAFFNAYNACVKPRYTSD